MEKKQQIEQILKRRFFVTQTGYPPQNGFMDYGPALLRTKQQMLAEYRKFFVTESVYELEPSAVLPYEVLKNSGHIDKFCDAVVTDGQTVLRADHFIEDSLGDTVEIPAEIEKDMEVIAGRISKQKTSEATRFSAEQVREILQDIRCETKHAGDLSKAEVDFVIFLHNLHSPAGLPLGPCKDFNLIFGLNGRQFLRPELAQSIFTNFRKLYEMNGEKLPFAGMCIGRSYRNEISARGGMIRTKEFEQAELEYFTEDGRHAGFEGVRDTRVVILPNTHEEAYETTLGEAHDAQTIASEAICYFLSQAQDFCLSIGVRRESLRYRQHSRNEMAHYANDCWDVEVKTVGGWVECAGIADRGTFDLTVHSKEVNTRAARAIAPKTVYTLEPNKADAGRRLRQKYRAFEEFVAGVGQDFIAEHSRDGVVEIEFEGEKHVCGVVSKRVESEFFTPRVIEPSVGVSRLLYCLVEQSFQIRNGRNVLSLPPKMCYQHCVVGFLKYLDEFEQHVEQLGRDLRAAGLLFSVCERSCSIGKKYASMDELGVPFFVTFDFETAQDGKVTIRERDSMEQARVAVDRVGKAIRLLVDGEVTWASLYAVSRAGGVIS